MPRSTGVAAAGERGVGRALAILRDEVDRVLALLGCPSASALDRSFVDEIGMAARETLPARRDDGDDTVRRDD